MTTHSSYKQRTQVSVSSALCLTKRLMVEVPVVHLLGDKSTSSGIRVGSGFPAIRTRTALASMMCFSGLIVGVFGGEASCSDASNERKQSNQTRLDDGHETSTRALTQSQKLQSGHDIPSSFLLSDVTQDSLPTQIQRAESCGPILLMERCQGRLVWRHLL